MQKGSRRIPIMRRRGLFTLKASVLAEPASSLAVCPVQAETGGDEMDVRDDGHQDASFWHMMRPFDHDDEYDAADPVVLP
eukprot:15482598-Alexandrium_andersonii.AAC.1